MADNKIHKLLVELGLSNKKTTKPYYQQVRDRDDVGVLKDEKSGVIFLDRSDHMDISHYSDMDDSSYWDGADRAEALKKCSEDDERRSVQFASYIKDKDVIDIGCGAGGFVEYARDSVKSISGVEPQGYMMKELEENGYKMFKLPEDVPDESFDVVTLFHVLEHFTEPIETLKEARRILRPNGTIIVEIPHAKDTLLKLEEFRKFTLWSEHLILHTKESVKMFLGNATFSNIDISGYQRYPLPNHIGWLVDGKPGGQEKYSDMFNQEENEKYGKMLKNTDQTDTLIAIAHK